MVQLRIIKALEKRITEKIEYAKAHTEDEFIERYLTHDLIECQHAFFKATGKYIHQ